MKFLEIIKQWIIDFLKSDTFKKTEKEFTHTVETKIEESMGLPKDNVLVKSVETSVESIVDTTVDNTLTNIETRLSEVNIQETVKDIKKRTARKVPTTTDTTNTDTTSVDKPKSVKKTKNK
jgi:hypothetical protein